MPGCVPTAQIHDQCIISRRVSCLTLCPDRFRPKVSAQFDSIWSWQESRSAVSYSQ